MRIITTKPFSSSRLGNVVHGKELEVEDKYAKHLIASGLAREIPARPSRVEGDAGKPSSFPLPAGESQAGSSLPAAPVSQGQTASSSDNGGKKTTYHKPKRSRS
jgi:hypothetical protein